MEPADCRGRWFRCAFSEKMSGTGQNPVATIKVLLMMKKKFSLSTTQIIMLSFLIVILVGSVLLALPVSSARGEAVPYMDALFKDFCKKGAKK